MPQLVAPLILLLAGLLALNMFLRTSPARLAKILKRGSGVLLIALGVLFLTRGLIPLALACFAGAFLVMGFGPQLWKAARSGSSGRTSRVRTSILSMELAHETGDLDGDVIAGAFAGRKLSELDLGQLLKLRAECLQANDQSARLLDAYLDRVHDGWRDADESGRDAGHGRGSGTMTTQQAYEILGLEPGASRTEINKAHRVLMKKFHPDHGGSEFLAQQINEARDILLAAM